MAIEMVRVPSATPNISNTDDFVGLRYAYGNQNGYVINKGLECSFTPLSVKFRINSGRLVLQGVEVDIDANGVEVAIDNVANTQYHTVYLKVDLSTNEAKILTMSDTSTYPTIESGDDLTQNTTGIAKMELYHFDATSGVISNVQKVVQRIDYTGTALVGYDISKGTIEERLDTLGFSEGSINITASLFGNYTTRINKIQKLGKFVIADFYLTTSLSDVNMTLSNLMSLGNVPEEYRPSITKNDIYKTQNNVKYILGGFAGCMTTSYSDWLSAKGFEVLIGEDGSIKITIGSSYQSEMPYRFRFRVAWEID